ncbi:MAG: MarR family transcriptional regulator [Pseudomonadota bacterium]|nr:MarR family transcriptional regulator [Pseudomonadota bacterium]
MSDRFPFEHAPGHLIRRAHQISAAIFAEETAAFDATPVQFAILSVLAGAPGIDQITLAQRVALDAATIGSVIGRLLTKGWLRRERGSADRRRKLLHLTAEGRAVMHGMTGGVQAVQQRLLAPLSADEQQHFLALLTKLVKASQPD